MKQAAAKTTTKSGNVRPSRKDTKTPDSSNPKQVTDPRQAFMTAALSMSWQLAIVVLVPILVGVKLDKHFNTLPLWTGIGFVIALICMALVVWRQVKLFSPKITQADIDAAKKLRDKEDGDDV